MTKFEKRWADYDKRMAERTRIEEMQRRRYEEDQANRTIGEKITYHICGLVIVIPMLWAAIYIFLRSLNEVSKW